MCKGEEYQMHIARVKITRTLILIIAALLIFAVYLPSALKNNEKVLGRESTVWELSEDAVCLYPECSPDTKGYVIDGNRFSYSDSDPQMGFPLDGEVFSELLIVFSEPSLELTMGEIYYASDGEELAEERKITFSIEADSRQVNISMPKVALHYIRIDINGNFALAGIYGSGNGFPHTSVRKEASMPVATALCGICILFYAVFLFILRELLMERSGKRAWFFFLLASLLRLWLGELVGIWVPSSAYYDDTLMIRYSRLLSYFSGSAVLEKDVMLKDIGMPVVINLINLSGIDYTTFLSLLWIFNGMLAVLLIQRMSKGAHRKWEKVAFLAILFEPIAFEANCGTRLYRNALLTPLYLQVFLLALLILFHLVENRSDRLRQNVWLSLLLGLSYSMTVHIKEDRLWLVVSMATLTLLMTAIWGLHLYRRRISRKDTVRAAASIAMPFLCLLLTTILIKGVNGRAFGIYELNARTDGETGRFLSNIYQTESEERTLDIWTPKDALEKVFEASETLRKNENLRDAVFHTPWRAGDIEAYPITGDFLSWIMNDALFDSGTVTTKREAEVYLRTVNGELEEAFQNGTLKKDHRFRLIKAVSGITGEELRALLGSEILALKNLLVTDIYYPGALPMFSLEERDLTEVLTNEELVPTADAGAASYRSFETRSP